MTIACIAIAFAMMPAASLGLTDTTGTDEDVLALQEGSIKIQDRMSDGGKFIDQGDRYKMEDVSVYDDDMSIYGFYLGEGRFGDALLIESNEKYLIMDTGLDTAADKLVESIKAVMGENNKLDVYISHVHGDHTGGLEKILLNFDVGTVYFPDIELCENYVTPTGKTVDQIYIEHVAVSKNGGADRIVYLRPDLSARPSSSRAVNTSSRFNVGGAVCTVMGPLGYYEPDDFIEYVKTLNGKTGTEQSHSLNNSSLCTMVECGDVRYLATGDIEQFEEAKLIDKYGDGLNCDIMKLPHHGLRTSGTPEFGTRTKAMWSFQLNHGYATGVSRTAINTAMEYGYNYGVANGRHSIIFDVEDGRVRVNIDSNDNNLNDDGYLKGWVPVSCNRQSYDDNGYIRTGLRRVKSAIYHFDEESGFVTTGKLKIDGTTLKFSKKGKLKKSEYPSESEIRDVKAGKKHTIRISWKKAKKANAYKIFRANSEKGKYSEIAAVKGGAKAYKDKSLKKGKTYYYKVRAVRQVAGFDINSGFSEVKCARAK